LNEAGQSIEIFSIGARKQLLVKTGARFVNKEQKNMPLEAHYDRCVLKCGSCGEELTKLGRMAPLAEAAAAGWGLIVEPNGAYDYACSVCLAKPKAARGQTLDIAAARRSRS
jgi:hypothetical protein